MNSKQAYDFIFNTHFWGNRGNAGKNYVRPYSKTKKVKESN